MDISGASVEGEAIEIQKFHAAKNAQLVKAYYMVNCRKYHVLFSI